MKKLYAIISIIPTVTLGTTIVVDNIFRYDNLYNLNQVINKEKLFDGIDLKMSRMKSYDDGYGNSILALVKEGIFQNTDLLNPNELDIRIYYGDYDEKNNIEFKYDNNSNSEEVILCFSVEILPKMNSSYNGRVIYTFDFRPKLSQIEKIYINEIYDSINKFGSFTSAINETFKSRTVINELDLQMKNLGIKNDIDYFNRKWFTTTEDAIINQKGDYSIQDYDQITNSITFRKDLFDVLPKTTRSTFFNIDKDISFYLSEFVKIDSKWFVTNEIDYGNFEFKNNFNTDSLVKEITPYLVEFFRSKLIAVLEKSNIYLDKYTKIDLRIKDSWKSDKPLDDNENLSSLPKVNNGQIITSWIEIWFIDDMRISLDQKDLNDGPGFHLDIGVNNEKE